MKIIKAESFITRLRGWLGRRQAPPGEALWLLRCRMIHTVGMRFAIDVIFLDRSHRVLRVDTAVPPCSIRWHFQASSVIELRAGGAAAWQVHPGMPFRPLMSVLSPSLAAARAQPVASLAAIAVLALTIQLPAPSQAAPPLQEEVPTQFTQDFVAEWTGEGDPNVDETVASSAALSSVFAPAPRSTVTGGAAFQSVLPPLKLLKPLAPETLARLFDEADSLYRGQHWAQALDAFRSLLELDPGHPMAWLRIGNLNHQRGQLGAAASAYRKASQAGARAEEIHPSGGDSVRAKALANLVAVNLELARQTLGTLQSMSLAPGSPVADRRESFAAEWQQLQHSAGSSQRSGLRPDVPTPAVSPRQSATTVGPARVSIDYLKEPGTSALGQIRELAPSRR